MIDHQQTIFSDQNPKFKLWKSLLTSKNRRIESLFILSGEKIILDFLADASFHRFSIKAVLIAKNHDPAVLAPLFTSLQNKGIIEETGLIFSLNSLLFKKLDLLGTHFPLLVCHRPKDIKTDQLAIPVGLELGLPLTDPANLGALCRTALSFKVGKIILTPRSCDPYHPKALRASSGATLKLEFVHYANADSQLGSNDFGLDLEGQNIYEFEWPKNIRLWLGEEGQGLGRNFPSQNKIRIPIQGMESLNATVAGSIGIFSYSQRFNKS